MKRVATSSLVALMFFVSCDTNSELNTFDTYEQNVMKPFLTMNEDGYRTMIKDLNDNINMILLETKPVEISLDDYKLGLIKGEYVMSKEDEKTILMFSEKLSNYGKFIADRDNIDQNIRDESMMLAIGGMTSPEKSMNEVLLDEEVSSIEGELSARAGASEGEITKKELINCGIAAIGFDIGYGFNGVNSKWKKKALLKLFTKVASRFLGPVGVAIAVGSFAGCLYNAY